ncbi:RcpA subunit [Elusimicrobium minutum Pei191]|uniref:RcpA subunit n=1 Tax=Elusimicrobium minutum (strain Pei191) TaxID=445932 RepID=B2KE11_ELUMP|nr:type II and III secretion system protein [Elusimicrobium minutum]ACC98757.1 RcpA subunit [Elusimicrobium minutum Pei191]
MKNKKFASKVCLTILAALLVMPGALHARKTNLVSVSADIVEISGSINSNIGFSWYNIFDFAEKEIPGVLEIGSFERKTALTTRLRLMENEGKAQILSNPKIVTRTGTNANISVGGQIPFPEVNNQGVGTSMLDYGVILNVMPTIIPEQSNLINLQVNLEVSAPDYSRTVSVGSTTVPSINKRRVETQVELHSGETLVIGGLKSSSRNVSVDRIPLLGRLPLIGLLFRNKDTLDEQRSLFLFVTVEIVE